LPGRGIGVSGHMFTNKQPMIALILCFFTVLFGTLGYVFIEEYTLTEGFYMTMITVTTVGFGEVKPLSMAGRGFTALLIIIGFISLAFTGRAVAESFLESVWSGKARLKKMKKEILGLKSHYIICGFGRVGASAVKHFINADADFVIIESNAAACDVLKEKGYLFIEGDATSETILLDAGIKSASGLIALLDSDPENLFISLTARELNPTLHIIARAGDLTSENKIHRAGADSVVSPFRTAGKQIALAILSATDKAAPGIDNQLTNGGVTQWISIQDNPELEGKTLTAVSQQVQQTIVGFRRGRHDTIFPDGEIKVKKSDLILTIEETSEPDRLRENTCQDFRKIVIVDDNPSILRVFSRLFRKAGFNPLTAKDGQEGLARIIEEKPVAAVIDFQLPSLSGIELCREIRANRACREIKLILFTSDKTAETRNQALSAGADDVVVKSADSSEIIKTVEDVLNSDSVPDRSHDRGLEKTKAKVAESLRKKPPQYSSSATSINVAEALETLDGDEELLKNCFDDFMDQLPAMLQDINEAIAAESASELNRTAHRFKGSLVYLAAEPAAKLANQLETMGEAGDMGRAKDTYLALAHECDNVKAFIAHYEGK